MALPVRVNSVHTIPKNITMRNAANVPLPPANATTVMQAKLRRCAAVLCDVGYSVVLGLEQEHLDGAVGVGVDLAEEGHRAPACDLADGVEELVPQRVLEGGPHVAYEVALVLLDQGALDGREDVLHDAHDGVVDDVSLGLRRTLA